MVENLLRFRMILGAVKSFHGERPAGTGHKIRQGRDGILVQDLFTNIGNGEIGTRDHAQAADHIAAGHIVLSAARLDRHGTCTEWVERLRDARPAEPAGSEVAAAWAEALAAAETALRDFGPGGDGGGAS